jgi:thioredoxin-like negative regulator of GroEL
VTKLLVFTAPFCAPCKRQKAEIDELLDECPDIRIDVKDLSQESDLALAQQHGIMQVPAQVLVDETGAQLKSHLGVLPVKALKQFVGL